MATCGSVLPRPPHPAEQHESSGNCQPQQSQRRLDPVHDIQRADRRDADPAGGLVDGIELPAPALAWAGRTPAITKPESGAITSPWPKPNSPSAATTSTIPG